MAAVAYLTCIPGNVLMAFFGDTFGRKVTLLFISATGAVCVTFFIINEPSKTFKS